MVLFNDSESTGTLPPINRDRIKQALDKLGCTYQVDDDGDILGGWEHGFFFFGITGNKAEILMVRGTWYGTLENSKLPEANDLVMTWNRETIWPKVYTVIDPDDNLVRVSCEHSVDYEFGLTDEQLRQHILCMVTTGSSLFEKLSMTFPEGLPHE
ncbi:type III secretion system chaperone family protein [Arcanobacterium ihumii]|uniref:YbjN domain-containing protein n=1 Tax=Arcanobacterium ihumii TaxID=2138162 RepID=UPI000F53A068|nr:YbjN domain-containing protein [Arcanobacterium ihumii]